MKITNITNGTRGFNSTNGPVLANPGEIVEANVFEREKQHIEATQWFAIDGEYTANPDSAVAVLAQAAPAASDELEALKKQLAERDAEIAKLKGDGLDRDDLKKQAAELGIEYARNASNEKIKELIDAKLAS